MKIVKYLNSALGIWFLTSVVGGVSIFTFEKYIDDREQKRTLQEEYELLTLEYEGRISQYSRWFMDQLSDREKRPNSYEFADCVTIESLKKSIMVLSGKPNFGRSPLLTSNAADCGQIQRFQSIFPQYTETSTIGILAKFRIVSNKLYPSKLEIGKEDGAYTAVTNIEEHKLRGEVLSAINSFLNPDAVIPIKTNEIDKYSVTEFRESIMRSFYKIGPVEFWYGDVFAG